MDPVGPSQEAIHVEVYVSHDQMDASDEDKAKYQASRPPGHRPDLDYEGSDLDDSTQAAAGCKAKLAAMAEQLLVPVPEKAPEGARDMGD